MSRDTVRARSDSGAPFLHGPPVGEGNGGEKMVLTAVDPDGGYHGSGFEELATSRRNLPHRGQLVNDKVPNVLRNVPCDRCRHELGVRVEDVEYT